MPFFYNSGSEFEEMFVGVGARRVRDLFKAVRAHTPSCRVLCMPARHSCSLRPFHLAFRIHCMVECVLKPHGSKEGERRSTAGCFACEVSGSIAQMRDFVW